MTDADRLQKLNPEYLVGAAMRRVRFGEGRGHKLAKAVGCSKGRTPRIVDATAGLGRDAFLLASLGCQVVLLERSPAVYALLQQTVESARTSPDLADVVARMRLVQGDARNLLPSLFADVVLVDPMHPSRKKTALVKEEMRLLRQLVGPDSDALELMRVALATAQERVVLKWARRAEHLEGLGVPSYQIVGKTTRYEVFLTRQASGTS